jgi:thiol-disulfide isomerase/thioredoxin
MMHTIDFKRIVFVAFFAFAFLVSACTSDTEPQPTQEVSEDAELAPLFSVPTASGEDFSLAEHQAKDGRPVFLNLWASWCFPCREEMPAINDASEAFSDIKFIGVAIQDSRVDAQAFADEIGVTYTIGFDTENSVNAAYGPLGLPASYIISADGVILERIFGKVTEQDLAEKFAKYFG